MNQSREENTEFKSDEQQQAELADLGYFSRLSRKAHEVYQSRYLLPFMMSMSKPITKPNIQNKSPETIVRLIQRAVDQLRTEHGISEEEVMATMIAKDYFLTVEGREPRQAEPKRRNGLDILVLDVFELLTGAGRRPY